MKAGMEISGDREVIARMEKLGADLRSRVQGAVRTSAEEARVKAVQNGYSNARVDLDSDGMGATIAPLYASYQADADAASFKQSVEKAIKDVVGG